jgi:ribosome-associated protein
MTESPTLQINDSLFIQPSELTFRASRSGGPGGQHVNTSSTRVELVWDVGASPSVNDEQRSLISDKLANRISGEGLLQIAESGSRSQHRNKEVATERFVELLREALTVAPPRRKTRPPRAAKEKRIREKKQRAEVKRLRGPVTGE